MALKKPYRGLTHDDVEVRYAREEFRSLDGVSVDSLFEVVEMKNLIT
jgi:hypothetical protein